LVLLGQWVTAGAPGLSCWRASSGVSNSGLIGLFLGPPISILLITTLLEIYLETYRQPDLAPSDV
jgi:hypothetical protein